eukprot:124030_1
MNALRIHCLKQFTKWSCRSSHLKIPYVCCNRRFTEGINIDLNLKQVQQALNNLINNVTDNNSNGMNSHVSELQSISHSLYHNAMMVDIIGEDTSKTLMDLSQRIDRIVLKLNTMEQNKSSSASLENIDQFNTQEIDSIKYNVNEDEDIYVASQEEVNEINKEMEELFGMPYSPRWGVV